MDDKPLTALQMKRIIAEHLFTELGFLGVFTECFNGSDVFGVRRTLYAVEYEIKISKSDLVHELKSIRAVIANNPKLMDKHGWNKYSKHRRYIGKGDDMFYSKEYNDLFYKPNEFYFAVPNELADVAVDGVKGTPYGVMAVGKYFCGYENKCEMWGPHFILKAIKMHQNKMEMKHIIGLIGRAAAENQNLRNKLYG